MATSNSQVNTLSISLASLRKRGVHFTSEEVSKAILLARIQRAYYAYKTGEASANETTEAIETAVEQYRSFDNNTEEEVL